MNEGRLRYGERQRDRERRWKEKCFTWYKKLQTKYLKGEILIRCSFEYECIYRTRQIKCILTGKIRSEASAKRIVGSSLNGAKR